MRKLFKAAADASPCIVFIDEIDAVGSKRNPMERQVVSSIRKQTESKCALSPHPLA